MLRGLGGMGIGYFLAQYIELKPNTEYKNKLLNSLLEIILLPYIVISLCYEKIHLENPLYTIFVFVILIALFLRKQGILSQFLSKINFSKYSKYCLSIYLMQGFIVYDIFQRVVKLYTFTPIQTCGIVMVFILLTIIWGIAANILIECVMQRLNKFLAKDHSPHNI